MNFHAAFDMPLAHAPEHPTTLDRRFDLLLERGRLARFQRNLREARRYDVAEVIAFWERRVCEALDAVWEAQENWKASRRHFA